MKEHIKAMLKESLGGLLREKNKTPEKEEKDGEDNKNKEGKEKDVRYDDVKNFFNKQDSITKVGVFREAGFSEEEIYQRLPYKKLDNEKNEKGGTYSFTKDEVDRIRTVTDKYPSGS
jgi:hypothetical protein